MNTIPKYLTLTPLYNQKPEKINISIGIENLRGARICFQDTAELGQDSGYISQNSHPNTGLETFNRYSLWISMFARYSQDFKEEEQI